MLDTAFDIIEFDEPETGEESLGRRIRKAMSTQSDMIRMAILLGSRRHPTLALYQHWYETGTAHSDGSHGVDATLVDLSLVSSAEADGPDLLLRGEPGFVKRCQTWHSGGYHQPDFGDPMAGYGAAEVTSDSVIRIEGAERDWAPSPLGLVTKCLEGLRDESREARGLEIKRSSLRLSDELRDRLWAWHAEHPDDARRDYDARTKRHNRVTLGTAVGVIVLSLVLIGAGARIPSHRWLIDAGVLLAMVTCLVVMFSAFPSLRRASEESWRRMRQECIIERGQATVIREGDARYVLFRENPVPLIWDNGGMTRYTIVRLDGDNLNPSYDPDTRIMSFSGDGIWQTDSIRYAIDRLIVPSVDIEAMEPLPSYEVADTFVPSLRTVVRMTGKEEMTEP